MKMENARSKEEQEKEEERRRDKEPKAEKEELKSAVSEKWEKKVEAVVNKGAEKQIRVPIISLNVTPETKRLEVDGEIPEIRKETRKPLVSFMELRKPTIEFDERKIDIEITHIEKGKKPIDIPTVRLQPLPKVITTITGFDTIIVKPELSPLPKVTVPIYRKSAFVSPKSILDHLDVIISEQVGKHLEKRGEVMSAEIGEVGQAVVEVPSPAVGGEEEIPDFFELTFGEDGGKIRARGKKIILLKDLESDSSVAFLEEICKRIYREKVEGEPEAVKIQRLDEMSKIEIEKRMNLSHKIYTINLDYTEKEKKLWSEIDEDRLWERLGETYTGEIGFIIFFTRDQETFKHYGKLLEEIYLKSQRGLNVVPLRHVKSSRELASLASGMVSLRDNGLRAIDKKTGTPINSTFDSIFNAAQKKFDQILLSVKGEEKGLFKSATNRNSGQIEGKKPESGLHFDIKVFLVRYLTHELRKGGQPLKSRKEIMEKIKTEESFGSAVPDIQVDSEAYEVETLFGEGEDADKKIERTIDKYDKNKIGKVNIVMDNLGFLMHLKDLKEKKELLKDKEFAVEFYTLDLQNKKLIPISDVIKKIKKIGIET